MAWSWRWDRPEAITHEVGHAGFFRGVDDEISSLVVVERLLDHGEKRRKDKG